MRLLEKRHVRDDIASGLGRVDLIGGGLARFVLYVENRLEDGTIEYEVIAKIVLPIDAVPDALMKASHACALTLVGTVKKLMPDATVH